MRGRSIGGILLLLALMPAAARGAFQTPDVLPAASLLLPYFEVDATPNYPESPGTAQLAAVRKTLFTVGNGSPSSVLVRFTLWTDYGIPTLSFHLVLGGRDIETIDLKQTFDGIIPQSPGGQPGCPATLGSRLPPDDIIGLRDAHSGRPSSLLGNLCGGHDHGDGRLRGYVTVDAVTACDDLLMPTDAGYAAILDSRNVLWGTWQQLDPDGNTAESGTLVHLEAQDSGAGTYTFYGRFNGFDGTDGREALGGVWGARFMNGGVFDGGTSLRVWREPREVPVPVACPVAALPPSQPGVAREVLAFDEAEEVLKLLDVLMPFPLVTQRVLVGSPALPVPHAFGWLLLNLNTAEGTTFAELKQAHVAVAHRAAGRFAIATDGFLLAHPNALLPNSAAGDTVGPYPGITATMVATGPFQIGQEVVYTITVTRTGPGLRTVHLEDPLPAQLTLLGADVSAGTAATMGNTVTWDVTLSDGTPSATITITVRIDASGYVLNVAEAAFDASGDGIADATITAARPFSVPEPATE